MRHLLVCLLMSAALALAGCGSASERRGMTGGLGADTRPLPARPAYYVAPPPPGTRRCMVWGEDMYGRRFCDRYYGS